MKLIVLKNNLRDGLAAVQRASAENISLPILKNVLIKTFNNKIQLSATNLELAITQFVSGKIIEDGSITIPLETLLTITNNIANDRIAIEVENNTLHFKTDNYEAIIQGLPEEEFPIIPKIENTKNYLQINTVILKTAVAKVINAAQPSEIRPEIGGILFDFQVTNFKLVATDSFRLAEKTIQEKNFTCTFQRGFKIIIPLKTAQEVLRINTGEELTICIDPNQILFKNNDIEIISRLIDGTYPDYEAIVPKSLETEMLIEREHLVNAVKLVSTFSGKVNDIKMKTADGKKAVEVYSSNQYVGENKYLVPAKIKGEAFEVSFNWRYLMDGLKNFDSNELLFGVNGDVRPAVLKNTTDTSYFYILMPIKGS
ncbi:MAG: DNA polymerase III subunit beta [Candidatus Harrisonbacteria bacterium RIFCSPLOWO2_02_FULL_45_10c]|uniref:Beta sliding clamp n=1 Tax=Candidatus Harrisonbacteria bacterium RIFCSPLOWO2_02_FULL_45_10c TaxID=1798410 RepID=A0A1G1ZR75_9BACT|nr:MAG: DNA polymerase III subunit beta [Candidatus Harrisonbacteria bacterium RIFCSPLOWO2_02_FULL_45_10c]